MKKLLGEGIENMQNPLHPDFPAYLDGRTQLPHILNLPVSPDAFEMLLKKRPINKERIRGQKPVPFFDWVLSQEVLDTYFPGKTIQNPRDNNDPINKMAELIEGRLLEVNPYFGSNSIGLTTDVDSHSGNTSKPFPVVNMDLLTQVVSQDKDSRVQLTWPTAEETRALAQLLTRDASSDFDKVDIFYSSLNYIRRALDRSARQQIKTAVEPVLLQLLKEEGFEWGSISRGLSSIEYFLVNNTFEETITDSVPEPDTFSNRPKGWFTETRMSISL